MPYSLIWGIAAFLPRGKMEVQVEVSNFQLNFQKKERQGFARDEKRPDFLGTLETDTQKLKREERGHVDWHAIPIPITGGEPAGETARYWYSISGLFRLVGACISLWGSTGARATALVKETSSRDKYATTRTTGAPTAAQTRASVGLAAAS